MTTAYWCVLVMILFPYIFTVLAKSGSGFNNHKPREYLQHLTGWRQRANNIQLNCFESTPAFGIAVIIAHLVHAHQSTIDMLAMAFVAARILYAIFYLTDKASFRTLFWAIGLGCVVGLFCIT
ncbi:MAG: MAPEG family protein [Gammaproteobacteria bacterium]|nr:MAPEG family protein [Gammaproteobacteria bacterium]